MKLEITAVTPLRSEPAVTLDGHELEHVTYPKTQDSASFREHRKALNLTLGEAAERLGLSVVEVSGLEHGAYTCDWTLARVILARVPRKKPERRKKYLLQCRDVDHGTVMLIDMMAHSKQTAEASGRQFFPEADVRAVTPAEHRRDTFLDRYEEAIHTISRIDPRALAEFIVNLGVAEFEHAEKEPDSEDLINWVREHVYAP